METKRTQRLQIVFRPILALAFLSTAGCSDAAEPDSVGTSAEPLCAGVKLTASPSGPSNPGAMVRLTATNAACSAGETPEYKFAYLRNGAAGPWVVLQDYAAGAAVDWNTAGLPSGKYDLLVYVRQAGGTSFQGYSYATFMIANVCTSATLAVTPDGPQPTGALLSLKAQANCTGTAVPEFRYMVKRQDALAYAEIAPYGMASPFSWDTSGLQSGTYSLLVYVRAAGNASGYETAAYGTCLLGSVCSAVSMVVSPGSPHPTGTAVTLAGSATCSAGASAEYRFLVRPPNTIAYTEFRPYSASPTALWNTSALAPGAYTLLVQTRSLGNPSVMESSAAAPYALTLNTQLAAGVSHTCVLANGKLKCFGRNLLGTPTGQISTDRGLEASDMGDSLPASGMVANQAVLAHARGAYHTCAIVSGGSVVCWGANGNGQLGLGDTNPRTAGTGALIDTPLAVALGTGRTAKALAAGASFSCAILDDDTVKCWGANAFGQLGLGDKVDRGDGPGEMGDNLPAVNLGVGRTAKGIEAGVNHACVLLDNDDLKCWGYNAWGQLGVGSTSNRGDDAGELGNSLPVVELGTGRHARTLALGPNISCALLDNGAVKCWGYNAWGQLGQGDTMVRGDGPGEMGDNLPAIALGTGRRAQALAAGGQHVCAILDSGSVKCWGYNDEGELGLGGTGNWGDQAGEMGDNLPEVSLGRGRTATQVMATYLNTCALLDDGKMKCWGASWAGMLGIGPSGTRGDEPGDMGDNLPGFDFGAGRAVVSLGHGFGYHFGCALLDNGRMKCWGANSYGQLGISRSSNTGDESQDLGSNLQPVDVGTGLTVVQAGAGDTHSCALLSDGRVKCWGSGRWGTLGQGEVAVRSGRAVYMGDNLPAVDLGAGRTTTYLAVGAEHSCAILDTGAVKCWGRNDSGQLGLGDTATRGDTAGEMGNNLPAVDLGGHRATQLSAGQKHTCAVLDNGTLRCWGLNSYGMLGLGDSRTRGDNAGEMGSALAAVNVGTGRTAQSVYTGVLNTCALLDNGSLKCWGVNIYGQLGQGDTLTRGGKLSDMGDALPAVNLGTGRRAIAVSLGQQSACALLDNETVKCWGYNPYGRLGYGNSSSRGAQPNEMGDSLPAVNLGTGKKATGIASGWYHSCAALADGSVKCWGLNEGGQLGLGDSRNRGDSLADLGNALPAVNLGSF